MPKLTDTQLILLSKAAARDDGAATFPATMHKPGAAKGRSQPRQPQIDARDAHQARHAGLAQGSAMDETPVWSSPAPAATPSASRRQRRKLEIRDRAAEDNCMRRRLDPREPRQLAAEARFGA